MRADRRTSGELYFRLRLAHHCSAISRALSFAPSLPSLPFIQVHISCRHNDLDARDEGVMSSSKPRALETVTSLTFDVFGTVVDWEGSVVNGLAEVYERERGRVVRDGTSQVEVGEEGMS